MADGLVKRFSTVELPGACLDANPQLTSVLSAILPPLP